MRVYLLSSVAVFSMALAGTALANPQADGGDNNSNYVESYANANAYGGNGGEGGDGIDADGAYYVYDNYGDGGDGGDGGDAWATAYSESFNHKTSAVSRQQMSATASGSTTQGTYYGNNSLYNTASVSGMDAAAGVFSAQAQAAVGSAQQGGVALSVAAHNINIQ